MAVAGIAKKKCILKKSGMLKKRMNIKRIKKAVSKDAVVGGVAATDERM